MVEVVTVGRFMGPTLLVQMMVRASQFAVNPTIKDKDIPAILHMEVAQALVDNIDIQEIGILARVLEEKTYRDYVAGKQAGGMSVLASMVKNDPRSTWLCMVGNATPTKDKPFGDVTDRFPHPIPINEFVISPEGLKRVLVMRDVVGFKGIKEALEERHFHNVDEEGLRSFIHEAVVDEISQRIADITGIDNSPSLNNLVDDVTVQSKLAYAVKDGWRRDMAGPYAEYMRGVNSNFTERQRRIRVSMDTLSRTPMRGVFRFEAPEPARCVVA